MWNNQSYNKTYIKNIVDIQNTVKRILNTTGNKADAGTLRKRVWDFMSGMGQAVGNVSQYMAQENQKGNAEGAKLLQSASQVMNNAYNQLNTLVKSWPQTVKQPPNLNPILQKLNVDLQGVINSLNGESQQQDQQDQQKQFDPSQWRNWIEQNLITQATPEQKKILEPQVQAEFTRPDISEESVKQFVQSLKEEMAQKQTAQKQPKAIDDKQKLQGADVKKMMADISQIFNDNIGNWQNPQPVALGWLKEEIDNILNGYAAKVAKPTGRKAAQSENILGK